MSLPDHLRPVTTEGQIMLHIAGQLDELLDVLRPAAPSVEPEATADAPATGEPEPKPKPAAKKAVSKKPAVRRTTKVDGR